MKKQKAEQNKSAFCLKREDKTPPLGGDEWEGEGVLLRGAAKLLCNPPTPSPESVRMKPPGGGGGRMRPLSGSPKC